VRLRQCETEAVAPFSVGLGVPSEPGSLLSTVEYMCNDVGWCSEDGVCGEDLHGVRVVVASRRSMSNVCARSVMCRVCHTVTGCSARLSAAGTPSALGRYPLGRRTPSLTIRSLSLTLHSLTHMNRVVDRWGSEAPPWAGGTVRARGRGTNAHLTCVLLGFSQTLYRSQRFTAATKFARRCKWWTGGRRAARRDFLVIFRRGWIRLDRCSLFDPRNAQLH
jgi:hypothetical protein